MALTKADMAKSLFNELGLNKRESLELVDSNFEELEACLTVGVLTKLIWGPDGWLAGGVSLDSLLGKLMFYH